MKSTIVLATAALLVLSGCQSTKSPEEQEMMSNLCTAGDANSSMLSMEQFNAAVMECGGYEVFTDDMLVGKTLSFSFSQSGSRVITINSDGTADYHKVKKGITETVTWMLTDKGNLMLKWENGYQWEWVLMAEKGNFMAVKSFGQTADGSQKNIDSIMVTVSES